jgi:nucleoside-diphosphate-sugar epimerase
MENKSISILGCGWLGLSLATKLASENYIVKGSTTSEKNLKGLDLLKIKPYIIKLNPVLKGDISFFDSEILFINIPPKSRSLGEDFHLEQIKTLNHIIETNNVIKKIIFISSTSVYPSKGDMLSEKEALPSHFLVKAEKLLSEVCLRLGVKFTIIRFGGLMGYDRIPCKYFGGNKGLVDGHSLVNYIHRDDAIGVISEIINQNLWEETFNVVSPLHPSRKQIVEVCCNPFGYEIPTFSEINSPMEYKTISVEKFLKVSNYVFKYPDPLKFSYLH